MIIGLIKFPYIASIEINWLKKKTKVVSKKKKLPYPHNIVDSGLNINIYSIQNLVFIKKI